MDELRQERDQQGSIRRTEGAMPHEELDIGRPFAFTQPDVATREHGRLGVMARRRRLDACQSVVVRCRDQHETPLGQQDRLVAGGSETASPLEDDAVERLPVVRATPSPSPGGADDLGSGWRSAAAGSRLQPGDRSFGLPPMRPGLPEIVHSDVPHQLRYRSDPLKGSHANRPDHRLFV